MPRIYEDQVYSLWSKFLAHVTVARIMRKLKNLFTGISFELKLETRISMLSQHQRMFLQEKVMELEQALFFSRTDSVLRLPVSVVNVLHVDEVGQVWFMVHRPTQRLNEFDREFGAKLEFYKKGKSFFLHLTGKACMITDPEEIHNAFHLPLHIRNEVSTSMVLLKFKVKNIEYYPQRLKPVRTVYESPRILLQPLAIFKSLQYIVKDIIPMFQSDRNPDKTWSNIYR